MGSRTSKKSCCKHLNNNFPKYYEAKKRWGGGHLLELSRGEDITAIFQKRIDPTWGSQQKTSVWASQE